MASKNHPSPQSSPLKGEEVPWIPWALVICFAVSLLFALRPPQVKTLFDLNGFAQLPVLNGGRTKPLDTIARTSLLVLSGKQTLRADGKTLSAAQWLVEVLFRPAKAGAYPVFEIDDPDVLGLMGIEQTAKRRYSFAELEPHMRSEEHTSELQSRQYLV